jgi:hypothetical protein
MFRKTFVLALASLLMFAPLTYAGELLDQAKKARKDSQQAREKDLEQQDYLEMSRMYSRLKSGEECTGQFMSRDKACDIAEALSKEGFTVERRQELGSFWVIVTIPE